MNKFALGLALFMMRYGPILLFLWFIWWLITYHFLIFMILGWTYIYFKFLK